MVYLSLNFNNLNAQISNYSNEFLNIGVDAASISKANSVVASISGVNSTYWNPAGLLNSDKQLSVALMHSNYFSGLAQYDFLSSSYKINDSLAIAFSIIRFGVDDIQNTLNLIDENGHVDYDRISYFSVADYAFLFSINKKLAIKNLSVGANLKLIYRRQGDFANAYGIGFDIGVQYKINNWQTAAVLRDASSTFNIWIFNEKLFKDVFTETNNEIPKNSLELTLPKLLLGIARNFNLNKKISFITEIDIDFSFSGQTHSIISFNPISIEPHFGFEFSYLKSVFIRGGVNNFQFIEDFDNSKKLNFQPTIGIGFSVFDFSLDYALTDLGDMTIAPLSHIFSLNYKFNLKKYKK
ncbi:MAG: PorV/PorQ family protein [Bacteroidales bacterium]|nr:PorV/PorQ family protein [Bacteroidales bacterium]